MAIDLEKLEQLAAKATPGPWFVTCNCTGKTFYTIKNDRVYIGEALGVYNGEANAAYIAAACNAIPKLLDERHALYERICELEAELEVYREEKQLEWERSRDERF
jgi:hypothetical protein